MALRVVSTVAMTVSDASRPERAARIAQNGAALSRGQRYAAPEPARPFCRASPCDVLTSTGSVTTVRHRCNIMRHGSVGTAVTQQPYFLPVQAVSP